MSSFRLTLGGCKHREPVPFGDQKMVRLAHSKRFRTNVFDRLILHISCFAPISSGFNPSGLLFRGSKEKAKSCRVVPRVGYTRLCPFVAPGWPSGPRRPLLRCPAASRCRGLAAASRVGADGGSSSCSLVFSGFGGPGTLLAPWFPPPFWGAVTKKVRCVNPPPHVFVLQRAQVETNTRGRLISLRPPFGQPHEK